MLRIALIHGGLAGAIIIGVVVGAMAIGADQGTGASQLFGYLVMLLALSLVFVGVKQYRDRDHGGVIGFVPALICGLAISAVAGVIYVAVWEAYLASTDYAFMTDYAAGIIAAKEAAGASEAEIAEAREKMAAMAANYANPLYRLPITFLEIFPVGLVVSVISAALLRNRNFLPARA